MVHSVYIGRFPKAAYCEVLVCIRRKRGFAGNSSDIAIDRCVLISPSLFFLFPRTRVEPSNWEVLCLSEHLVWQNTSKLCVTLVNVQASEKDTTRRQTGLRLCPLIKKRGEKSGNRLQLTGWSYPKIFFSATMGVPRHCAIRQFIACLLLCLVISSKSFSHIL
jgi:hypothetical protein